MYSSLSSPLSYISISYASFSHYQAFCDLRFMGAKRGVFIGRTIKTETAASTVQRIKVSLSDAS